MEKNETIDRLISTIVEACRPEYIYIIRHFEKEERGNQVSKCTKTNIKKIAIYDLLILVREDLCYESLDNHIEDQCKIIANACVLVYPIEKFVDLVQNCHPFIQSIIDSDSQVYNAEESIFPDFENIERNDFRYCGSIEYTKAMLCADEFIASAQLHILRRENTAAAFSIHQSAVQLYMFAIQKKAGFRIISEDILRLQRYASWISEEIGELFRASKDNTFNVGVFLQKAHYHARFNPHYNIAPEHVSTLMDELMKLRFLTRQMLATDSSSG